MNLRRTNYIFKKIKPPELIEINCINDLKSANEGERSKELGKNKANSQDIGINITFPHKFYENLYRQTEKEEKKTYETWIKYLAISEIRRREM